MISFLSDYTEGAHPRILRRLEQTNMEQTAGYGEDEYCAAAAELIKRECKAPDAAVHFLVGGTQANTTVIAAALRPYQGVLCPDTGHINVHETGAVEGTGHKVLPLPANDGKITAGQIRAAVTYQRTNDSFEHIVEPAMAYISSPAENGLLYSKSELTEISETCRELGVLLFLDGARMGYGLMSPKCSVTLADIAQLCDVFYIGGTKVGALFGEAVVITNDRLKRDFRYMIKRQGGMLAKGRLLGIQFQTLFEDGLYYEISKHGVDMAMRIKQALIEKGYDMWCDSYTNQQFPIISGEKYESLSRTYALTRWEEQKGGRLAVRIATSWATEEKNVERLINDL